MKLVYLFSFLIIISFSKLATAQSIVVVNVQDLIDNNKYYKETIKDIEINQKKYLYEFEKKENEIE